MFRPGIHRHCAVALALLVLFAGLAVFSPLHKHDPKSSGRCSLNNLEGFVTDGQILVLEIPKLTILGAHSILATFEGVRHRDADTIAARGPPQLSA
jgi:hypothetical protein